MYSLLLQTLTAIGIPFGSGSVNKLPEDLRNTPPFPSEAAYYVAVGHVAKAFFLFDANEVSVGIYSVVIENV